MAEAGAQDAESTEDERFHGLSDGLRNASHRVWFCHVLHRERHGDSRRFADRFVGWLIIRRKPTFSKQAKRRLFSYFPAIFWVWNTLQRLVFRSRLSPKQPLSGGNSETNTLRVSGL